MAAVPETIEAIGVLATFGDEAGIDDQSLLMFGGHHLGDGGLVERHPIKGGVIPPGQGPLVIRAVAAHIAKGGLSREHEQESQQMGNKLALRFLGLLETTQYTLEQSHGVPPGSVVWDNTTLGGSDSCGYPSHSKLSELLMRLINAFFSPCRVQCWFDGW